MPLEGFTSNFELLRSNSLLKIQIRLKIVLRENTHFFHLDGRTPCNRQCWFDIPHDYPWELVRTSFKIC